VREKFSEKKLKNLKIYKGRISNGATRHGVRQRAVRAASQFSAWLYFGTHEDGRAVHRSSRFNRTSLKNITFFKRRRTGWEIEAPVFGEHGPSARA